MYQLISWPMPHSSTQFGANPLSTFCLIQLTVKHTNKKNYFFVEKDSLEPLQQHTSKKLSTKKKLLQ